MLKTKKGVIMFTDIKNFTLKTSLLTPNQINKLIQKLEKILVPWVKKHHWEIVKIIWDAHMVVFSDIIDSINCAIEIQEELFKINVLEKIDLNRIKIKVSLNYGTLSRKMTIKWPDYFWDAINIGARIIEKTPATKIYITEDFHKGVVSKKYNNLNTIEYLWDVSLKWILYKQKVYNINYNNEQDTLQLITQLNWRTDETELKKKNDHIDSTIFQVSSIAAIISLQPVPFFDIYSAVFLHIYLAKEISKEYDMELSKDEIKESLTLIFWSIGWAYWLSQVLSWVAKIWVPVLWWYLVMPMNFALTFWIWKVLNYYFYNKSVKNSPTNTDIRDVFLSSRKQWLNIWKKQKNKILSEWKKYKDEFVEKMKEYKKSYWDVVEKLKE